MAHIRSCSLCLAINVGMLLLRKLGTFLLENVQQRLRTLLDLIEGALSLADSLVVVIAGSVLLGESGVNDLETGRERLHVLLNLALLFFLAVNEGLDLGSLLNDSAHLLDELSVVVVQSCTERHLIF